MKQEFLMGHSTELSHQTWSNLMCTFYIDLVDSEILSQNFQEYTLWIIISTNYGWKRIIPEMVS